MGQQEVVDFLKQNPDRWFFARDINTALGNGFSCTIQSLRRLRETRLVKFRKEICASGGKNSSSKKETFVYKSTRIK